MMLLLAPPREDNDGHGVRDLLQLSPAHLAHIAGLHRRDAVGRCVVGVVRDKLVCLYRPRYDVCMTQTDEFSTRFREKYGSDVPQGDGDCFVTAVEVADRLSRDDFPDVRIVHGEPLGTGGEALGIRFPHAWVEFTVNGTTFVVDESNGNSVTIHGGIYYEAGNIVEADTRRYTTDEARAKMLHHGHYGPWGGR